MPFREKAKAEKITVFPETNVPGPSNGHCEKMNETLDPLLIPFSSIIQTDFFTNQNDTCILVYGRNSHPLWVTALSPLINVFIFITLPILLDPLLSQFSFWLIKIRHKYGYTRPGQALSANVELSDISASGSESNQPVPTWISKTSVIEELPRFDESAQKSNLNRGKSTVSALPRFEAGSIEQVASRREDVSSPQSSTAIPINEVKRQPCEPSVKGVGCCELCTPAVDRPYGFTAYST